MEVLGTVSVLLLRAMASNETNLPNVYAYRGRQLLSAYHDRNKDTVPPYKLPDMTSHLKNQKPSSDLPICIIGAGAAGLYTAMILESLGISYQIIDASTQDRVGGRIFTYNFPNSDTYDYYVRKDHLCLL